MKALITGNGGSGKTAICKELRSRGYESIDADDNGVARWEDAQTGKPIDVDPTKFVDYSKVAWNWNRTRLLQLLDTDNQLFICGSASNQFDFYPLFDRVFVLNPSAETQRQRLATRAGDYGKDTETMNWIIEDQRKVVEASRRLGAVIINADGSIDETANQILAQTDEP